MLCLKNLLFFLQQVLSLQQVLNYHISITFETELPLPPDIARMFLPNAKRG